MRHLILAAALCAALPALAQPAVSLGDGDYGSPPGFRGGGPSLPAPSYPALAPYPRAGEAPVYLPQPPLDETAQRIKQLEQQNRLLSLEWQRKVFEDAMRLRQRHEPRILER